MIEILFILAIALYSVIQNAGAATVQEELHPINSLSLDEPGLNLTVLGSLGGPVLDVAVQGNYAFASYGPELKVIDISNPDELTQVASLTLRDNVIDMAFSPPYVVIAPARGGLSMIDITDPLNPQITGFYEQRWGASAIDIVGSYAYFTTGNRLEIIDITDPQHPTLQGSFLPEPSGLLDIEISGNYAYIARGWVSGRKGIGIFDISNPTTPIEVGYYPSDFDYEASLAIAGETLYLSGDHIGLQILDISTPTAPFLVSAYPLPNITPVDIAVAGEYAYLAWRNPDASDCIDLCQGGLIDHCQGGLQVMDVSNPQNPSEMGNLTSPGTAHSLALAGDRLMLTRQKERHYYGGELQSIDIANPAAPALLATLESPLNRPENILVQDKTAYIVENYAGIDNSALRIVDVSSPTNLVPLGSFEVPGKITDADVADSNAYLVEVTRPDPGCQPVGGGFRILDVSDPQSPSEIGFFNDSSWQFWSLDVQGSYAYLLAQDFCPNFYGCTFRLWIMDISNPAVPQEAGMYEFYGNNDPYGNTIYAVIQGGYAYLALWQNGLIILDISNPANPSLVGSLPSSGAEVVYVAGDYAYLGDGSGVAILSLHDRGIL